MALVLLVLQLGCMPPTFPEDQLPGWEERPVEATYSADMDTVWTEALAVFSDLYPLDEIDRSAGRLTTEWVIGSSDYIFNVFAGTKIPEKVRFRMVVEFTEKSGRPVVRVRNHEQVEKDILSANLTFTGAIYEWIDVPSSTKKEREALERIAARLDKKSGKQVDLDLRE